MSDEQGTITLEYSEDHWWATLWMGLFVTDEGYTYPIQQVYQFLEDYFQEEKWCVSVTPTRYFYTKGAEDGVSIGMLQYLRFKEERDQLHKKMVCLAKALMVHFRQAQVTIVTSNGTYMLKNNVRARQIELGRVETKARREIAGRYKAHG